MDAFYIKNCTFKTNTDLIIEMVEGEYGPPKAQLVSDILNADEQTIERVLKVMEKNDD
jgi:hypothetical protein